MTNVIIYVVIATSLNRTNMLINKALFSVYNQKKINSSNIKILIVDDNKNDKEIDNIKNQVKILRSKFNFKFEHIFNTKIIKNVKTKYYSGTGSWNTAIEIITNVKNENSYIAILDDDDYYCVNYLSTLFNQLDKQSNLIAIFSPITWEFNDRKETFFFTINDLTKKQFFIKNPGVQGSNMFFKSHILKDINGFDETLMSATDRDLMIRFIDYLQKKNLFNSIYILDKSYIFYNATNSNSITNNKKRKYLGLDKFYLKYKDKFSSSDLSLSLKRAKKLFDYDYK